MTCGIYAILHDQSGKLYVGKSKNIERRWWSHQYYLKKNEYVSKVCNRYLYNAVKKYGIENFSFHVLEETTSDFDFMAKRELWWMEVFDKNLYYNLRKDSSSGMEVHQDTKFLMSLKSLGSLNPNYNNKWSEEQKLHMSKIAKARHASGKYYGEEFKKRISLASKLSMQNPEIRNKISRTLKIVKRKYKFLQFDRQGNYIKTWGSVDEILEANPTWKWQNIYSVCNGYKPTYMNFVWKKELL